MPAADAKMLTPDCLMLCFPLSNKLAQVMGRPTWISRGGEVSEPAAQNVAAMQP